MIRKQRKIRTLRGSRTCGGGNPKKRRGGGNRGGRGLAGSGKSKKTKSDMVRIQFPGHIGRRGFKRPQKVKTDTDAINIQELDENVTTYLQMGAAEKKGNTIFIDAEKLGISKVLGRGKLTKKLDVRASAFSESAVKKIEEMGGKAHAIG